MQVSNIKETPDAESTWVPMAILTARKITGRPMPGYVVKDPLEMDPTQEREEEQLDFI